MTDLEELIEAAIRKKVGNKEFVLYRIEEGEWMAAIGNPSSAVLLMESSPDVRAEGKTPRAAVENLIAKLRG